MKIFANLKNGDQTQIELVGDAQSILNYIEEYQGDDLGNDIILEDFITDFNETGVIIYA
jgi:hypothetical protein